MKPSAQALVPFVSVAEMMAIIHRTGLENALVQLTDRIESDFRRWPLFDKTPRVASHSPIGVIELMPTSDGDRYAFKYVNGHPRGARTLALIGNGAQAEFQALALRAVCGIDTVRLYDTDPAASAKCAAHLRRAGMGVTICDSVGAACEGAQVITTCTADKRNATVLHDNMIGAGVHINAIGGDCPGKTELAPAILTRATTFVEYEPQTRIEGEIQQMPADYPVQALWQVLEGQAAGRTAPGQITLFDGVGFAVEDFSALCWLADQLGPGSSMLDMIADPDDPRDLYGMLMRAA